MKLRLHLILALCSVAASQGPIINATNTTIHTIQVGANGQLRFNPSTAFVPVGEVVQFDFYPMVSTYKKTASFDYPLCGYRLRLMVNNPLRRKRTTVLHKDPSIPPALPLPVHSSRITNLLRSARHAPS